MFVYIVSLVLVISVTFINAQSCQTPKHENGNCISLFDCPPLLTLLKNQYRTEEEDKLLRSSQCGSLNKNTPKVCCPTKIDCKTPEGKPGECINLYKCKYLADMLRGPQSNQNLEYVKKSVCEGPEEYSICCGSSPTSTSYIQPTTELKPVSKPHSDRYKVCTNIMKTSAPTRETGCCGIDSSSSNKIIGGKATGIDQYPWLVIIEYLNDGNIKLLCGGSLISGKYVLTAGHCVKGRILKEGIPYNVRLGEYNTTNNGPDCISSSGGGTDCTPPVILAPIETTIPHPEYNPFHIQRRHDIALIKIRTSAQYTDFIRPICLPSIDYAQNPPPNVKFYAAGWGRFIQIGNFKKSSAVKMDVDLPFVDRDMCQAAQRTQLNGRNLVLWNGQMCAGGEQGKDTCRGDSGGPLMYANSRIYEVAGIVSFGPEICGQLNIPGVYTNVYEYLPWIRQNME